MTQREVAQGINISRPHYSAIEQGRTMVNYKHLYNLAKFFRVRMGDLVTFSMLRRSKKRG
jgi:transcriptional regulator with XRE-family HTH domain